MTYSGWWLPTLKEDTVCLFEMLAPTYRELDGVAFRPVRKASCPFAQPPVHVELHVELLGSHWTDFHQI
jgi:hypothetical protein